MSNGLTWTMPVDALSYVILEYFEDGGGAMVNLDWESASQPRQRVPQERLLQPGATPALPLSSTTQELDYAYDLAGNRTDVWVDTALQSHLDYNAANQVVSWSYDADGNMLGDGTANYTYVEQVCAHDAVFFLLYSLFSAL